jgi:hypothetical protein
MGGIWGECDGGEDGIRGRQVSSEDVTKIYLATKDKDQQQLRGLKREAYEIPEVMYSCWIECRSAPL